MKNGPIDAEAAWDALRQIRQALEEYLAREDIDPPGYEPTTLAEEARVLANGIRLVGERSVLGDNPGTAPVSTEAGLLPS